MAGEDDKDVKAGAAQQGKTEQGATDEFDFVEVDEKGQPLKTTEQHEERKQDGSDDDERDDGADGDEDEERAALGANDGDGDDPNADKKAERKRRRQRQKAARERDRNRIRELEGLLGDVSQRLQRTEMRQGRQDLTLLDNQIGQTTEQLRQANAILTDAMSKQQPQRVTEALNLRDQLNLKLGRLNFVKDEAVRSNQRADAGGGQPDARGGRPAPQPMDPIVANHVADFQRKHRWYDPAGRDADSRAVLALDREVAGEGYDPSHPDYWDELQERMREQLPHKFHSGANGRTRQNGDGRQPQRNAPPVGGGGSNGGGGDRVRGKTTVKISPERKQAMIEAGAWEDPKKRQRYLASFAKWDAENAQSGGKR